MEPEPRLSTDTTAVASRSRGDNSAREAARRAGHARRATWDSSFSTAHERGLLRAKELRAARLVGAPSPGATAGACAQQQQHARAMKRQTGLARRVHDYIRPAA